MLPGEPKVSRGVSSPGGKAIQRTSSKQQQQQQQQQLQSQQQQRNTVETFRQLYLRSGKFNLIYFVET